MTVHGTQEVCREIDRWIDARQRAGRRRAAIWILIGVIGAAALITGGAWLGAAVALALK